MTATCPWCDAPRSDGATCPKCGADYAKAESIRKFGRAAPAASASPPKREAGSAALFSAVVEAEPIEDRALG